MQNSQILIELQITCPSWRKIPRLRSRIQTAAQAALDLLPKKLQKPASATVLLAGNAKIRQLNKDFRGIDKATNVLSFPQFSPQELTKVLNGVQPTELGDIALAYQYVVSEAKSEDKILINHITHLIVHGILHLFGYDHLCERDAVRMETLEVEIMKSLGLPNPYEQTAPVKHSKRR